MDCPVCGSPNLNETIVHESISDSFGANVEIEKKNYECLVCGAEGDLFNENEPVISSALERLDEAVVKAILTFFSQNNVSFAGIERALGLPQRTLTKWKNSSPAPSSAAIALLKYLRVFPWLLDVAESKFDYDAAQRIHLNSAMRSFIEKMTFIPNEAKTPGMITTVSSTVFFISAPTILEGGQISVSTPRVAGSRQLISIGSV